MANAFGQNPDSSLENMLRTGADLTGSATGAARQGVGAAQAGLAMAQGVGQDIDRYLGQAGSLAGNATRIVNGADADIDAMRSLVPQIGSQVNGISRSADALSNLAALIGAKAGDISAYAPQVTGLANTLLGRVGQTDALAGRTVDSAQALQPHVDALTALSEHLFGHGHEQIGRANAEMDEAAGLRNLDPASSANAAFWRQIFDAVNPETMAARAMADVQRQSDSANAQMTRDLARRGVSLSSGASAALRRQMATALASATAGAMNRGRLAGYDKQAGILSEVGKLANDMMTTGNSMFKTGTDAEAQAAAARRSAADVQEAMGRLFGTAAEMFGIGDNAIKGAGGLYASAAGIEEGSGKMLSAAADAEDASTEARGRAVAGLNAQAGIHKDATNAQLAQANALNDTAKVHQGNAQVKNQYLSNLNDANRTVVSSYGTLASAFDAAARYYLNAAGQEISANNSGGGHSVGGGGVRTSGGGGEENTGAWVDLTHGKASHADGAQWVWDPNAPVEPAVE